MAEKKEAAKKLKEKLLIQRKNAFHLISDKEMKACDKFCEGYKEFMNKAKIEREAGIFIAAISVVLVILFILLITYLERR